MEKKDRLSEMPDPILGIILSKIPIPEAISCSLVSKRLRHAYTHISELKISPLLLLGRVRPDAMSMARAENIVSNFLRLAYHLEVFHLDHGDVSRWRFTHENVSRWLHYAASKNVQRLTLCGNALLRGNPYIETERTPSTLFSCARLTSLHISDYILSNIPTDLPRRFNHLITCSLVETVFLDECLASFIAHCPLLQSLVIKFCVGLFKPVISAPNITHLDLNSDGDYGIEILTINCPKLITLETAMIRNLTVNGVCFHDLSYAVLQLKMQCGSLIELRLKPFSNWEPGPFNFSADRILEIVGTFKSLKKLSIVIQEHLERENKEMVAPLFALLERLRNLELLHMGGIFALELARDRIPPCLSSPLANLRIVQVVINNFDEKEISVLGCLLQSAPALQIMEFYLPKKYEDALYIKFLEKMLYLRRASVQARIRNAGSL